MSTPTESTRTYMTVRQVADYLQINEKKVYALINESRIPATRATGKWMFPRELVDRWLIDSSHRGLLLDKLVIAGPDDALLLRCMDELGRVNESRALVAYTHRATRPALDLLKAGRIDVGVVHWGRESESQIRHPALLKPRRDWILVRGFKRELGLLYCAADAGRGAVGLAAALGEPGNRWALRENVEGVWRFFLDACADLGIGVADLDAALMVSSEREAGASVAGGIVDIAPGARATATEFGLSFHSLGWERLDFAMHRGIWFRRAFQALSRTLVSKDSMRLAERLGGYDFEDCGQLIWGDE